MKKLTALVLALILAISFAACSGSKDDSSDSKKKKEEKTTTAAVQEDTPADAVARLEAAFNAKDLTKLGECLTKEEKVALEQLAALYSDPEYAELYEGKDANEAFFEAFAEDENGEAFDIKDLSFKFTVSNVQEDGDKATADIKVETYNGATVVETSESPIDLVKEDGTWKVVMGLADDGEDEEIDSIDAEEGEDFEDFEDADEEVSE